MVHCETEIINGLLLSDAHLTKPTKNLPNSHIELEQSEKHEEFVNVVQNHLTDLGWNTNTYRYLHKNTNTWGIRVYASYNKNWTKLRHKWYLKGKKIVPNDLVLTPKTLAYWFMGDGSCWWGTKKTSTICFYTQGFHKDYVIRLKNLLNDCGIHLKLQKRSTMKNGFILQTGVSTEINHFFDIVEPYIIPSFQYKIKRPSALSRIEQAKLNGYANRGKKHNISFKNRCSIIQKEFVKNRTRDIKGRFN